MLVCFCEMGANIIIPFSLSPVPLFGMVISRIDDDAYRIVSYGILE